MTDRELLELAANAASLNIKAQSVNADDIWIGLIVGEKHTREKKFWNPLEDDGDALRLAVKLQLEIGISAILTCVESRCNIYTEEDSGDNTYAATRRAIVSVAAKIGKSMEVTK
jgi:hypothetical protein